MILCDTNILIEAYRNNIHISGIIKNIGVENLAISDVTCIELFSGAKNKRELHTIRKDISNWIVLPIQREISIMAVSLVERYCLSHKLDLPDSLIAATAIYHKLELFTLNLKDFTFIPELQLYLPSQA
ncbi:MAG: type II toxin-antitoxin system VapC family toxin [Tannerellaceae bacterium]|jgi:predicted nucleic acid-binding protein|nr:type II toxin-antitoxin system VapC family toxin [Tannerellaceae bacterium]